MRGRVAAMFCPGAVLASVAGSRSRRFQRNFLQGSLGNLSTVEGSVTFVAHLLELLAAFAGGHRPQMGSPEVLHAFHATYLCVGLMSILAAAVFLQLGRKEAPCGSPNVTDAS